MGHFGEPEEAPREQGSMRRGWDHSRSSLLQIKRHARYPLDRISAEVAFFLPRFCATETDRRLFVSDIGTCSILSVKLGYHAEETVALKDVPDRRGN